MRVCSAFGCSNHSNRKMPGITFHKFPSDPKSLEVWLCAVNKDNWKPTPNSRLCSAHFSEHMLVRKGASVRLKPNAVPNVTLPSFMKKALDEKQKIEQTYKEDDFKPEVNNVTSNGNVHLDDGNTENQDDKLHENGSNIFNNPLSHENLVINSSCLNLSNRSNTENAPKKLDSNNLPVQTFFKQSNPISPMTINQSFLNQFTNPSSVIFPLISGMPQPVPVNSYNIPPILYNNIPSISSMEKSIITCDASTSTVRDSDTEAELILKLESCNKMLENYKKKIRKLQQQSRRYKSRLMNTKHSIFSELQKRKFLSNESDFRKDSEGCLLDRHSVKVCQSSDTEESEDY